MDEKIEMVNTLLAKVMTKEKPIIPGHNLVEDLGLNSIQFMELISQIENRFDILVPIQKLQSIKKVDDLYKVVCDLENFCRV
jgi:acyl carrier protein